LPNPTSGFGTPLKFIPRMNFGRFVYCKSKITLGYLPQDFGVYPRMSAEALLDHIAILKGVNDKKQRREQILSLLHSVDLFKHKTASVAPPRARHAASYGRGCYLSPL